MPLGKHGAQIRVRKTVQRIHVNLFVERLDRLFVVAIEPIGPAHVGVGILIVRVDLDLLAVGRNCILRIPLRQICIAKVVPSRLVLGFYLHSFLQQLHRERNISALERRESALVQFVGLQVLRRFRRSRYRALHGDMLDKIGKHGAPECQVLACACDIQLPFLREEAALRREHIVFELVAGLILGVIPLHRERQWRSRRILCRQLQLDAVYHLTGGAHLDRLRVAALIHVGIRISERELGQRQIKLGFLLRPIKEVGFADTVFNFEWLTRSRRISDLKIANVSIEPRHRVHVLHQALPLLPGHAPEHYAQQQFGIASQCVVNMQVELA